MTETTTKATKTTQNNPTENHTMSEDQTPYRTNIVEINGQECIQNANGAYVPVAKIKEIDLLRDDFVHRLVAKANTVSQLVQAHKEDVMSEIDAFVTLSAEQHNVELRGRKGGFSLMSYDGLEKVQVANADRIAVNEKVSIARELVFRCLKRWSKGAEPNLLEVIRGAFETDKAGHLSVAKLLGLRTYKIEGDAEWKEAMEALADGLTVNGSKTYVRFYRRASVEEAWEQIALG